MSKKKSDQTSLQKIVNVFPDNLSENALNEISTFLDKEVDLRLESKKKEMSAAFNSLLQTRIDELKEVALAELLQENENLRMVDGFNKILEIIVEYADKATLGSVLKERDEMIISQQNSIKMLEKQLKTSLDENTRLERSATMLTEEVNELTSQLNENFESSERAIVISEDVLRRVKQAPQDETPDEGETTPLKNYQENSMLTEEVLNVARLM